MKKVTDPDGYSVSQLLGLGQQSARKSYYPELTARMAELEAERNRYKWLFENALHGIFQASLGGRLLAANPALAAMLGDADVAATLERCASIEALFAEPGEAQRVAALLHERGHLQGFTTWLAGSDGRRVPVALTLLRKPDQGEEILVEGFVADITERERARQELLALNARLEARVRERTQRLEQLNADLAGEVAERRLIEEQLRAARDLAQEANRSKDRYLAAASHDLLQPLNAARLLVSTLRERKFDADTSRLVDTIHLSLEGAEELLTDLLDIARLDQERIQPQRECFSLSRMLCGLVAEYAPRAQRKALRFRCVESSLCVDSDFRLLGRVLRNLLSNACRYTESGSVLLGVRRRGDAVSIEVHDSGPGIPADQLQAIFEEYHQLNAERARNRQGVGLGLAIVERICQRLDMAIEVTSRPGRGSRFAVRVPIGQPSPALEAASVTALPESPLQGRRMLVVDNDSRILLGMQALLEQWGMECHTAHDLDEALAQGLAAPDVLLVDLHLDAGETGDRLVEKLRRHWRQPTLPAVVITADRSEEWRRSLAGLDLPLLHKPVRPGKLRAVLSQLLGRESR
ncbi:NahK/ErcS family hybrid sensor histidine kinase/response regulator [Halomonas sp. MCCC 1A11057]|jgi:PAS domain S-box-containing protein|uniref:PAS domain-containing hybrid sensor histidine kinase/response regulator n=1 Tax=Halomonas sp. MCCC 1A11057 TaxID=2733482 RepID=UPI001F189029|nr:NahK/ErcS family hybrid sensor histidine kinase/response regulator [Halomonas sp. MCCC 1A11057]MCE8034025.1 PAS domain S-box protein [Halomonas sp. MCCC 1A11057]